MLLSKVWVVLQFIAIIFISLTSDWFLHQPILNKVVISCATLSLFFYLKFKALIFKIIFLLSFFVLVFVQISSTNISNTYLLTDHQKYINQNRLNQYPASLARIGNIIENRLDTPIIYQLRQNFFDSLDVVNYFKNFFPSIFFIPLLIGLCKYLKTPNFLFSISIIFSLIILSLIGTHGSFGPIIIFPFILMFISHYSCEK